MPRHFWLLLNSVLITSLCSFSVSELVAPWKESAGKEGISLKMKVQENFTENESLRALLGSARQKEGRQMVENREG